MSPSWRATSRARADLPEAVQPHQGQVPGVWARAAQLATTGMRVRCVGPAVTASRSPTRKWGAALMISHVGPGAGGQGSRRRRDMDQLALGGATADDSWISLGRTLDQDLLQAADPSLVPGQGAALHHHSQPLEALGHHLRRHHLVGAGGGLGPRPGRVDEGVGAVVARLCAHLEGALEVGFGLAGEAHDDVGGDRQVLDGGAGPASRSR